RSALHGQYSLAAVRSKRRRAASDVALLERLGDRVRVYELQGDLVFSALESVVRHVVETSTATDIAVLDMRRVTRVDGPAMDILLNLYADMVASGRLLLFAAARRHPAFLRALDEQFTRLESGQQLH